MERQSDEQQPIIESTMTVAEAVAEALAQVERGEVYEVTDELWEELLRESEREAALGLPVRYEVKY